MSDDDKGKAPGGAPTVRKSFMRRFVLDRTEDATGTSGTGVVAEGVCFSSGKVALTWFSHYGAVNVYDSQEVTKVLHGHGGKTLIEYLDRDMTGGPDLFIENAAMKKYISEIHHAIEPLVGMLRMRSPDDPLKGYADNAMKAMTPSEELLAILRGKK